MTVCSPSTMKISSPAKTSSWTKTGAISSPNCAKGATSKWNLKLMDQWLNTNPSKLSKMSLMDFYTFKKIILFTETSKSPISSLEAMVRPSSRISASPPSSSIYYFILQSTISWFEHRIPPLYGSLSLNQQLLHREKWCVGVWSVYVPYFARIRSLLPFKVSSRTSK